MSFLSLQCTHCLLIEIFHDANSLYHGLIEEAGANAIAAGLQNNTTLRVIK